MLSRRVPTFLLIANSRISTIFANRRLTGGIGKDPLDVKFDEIEDKPNFPGCRSNWTTRLTFVDSESYDGIPVFRVMNREGKVIEAGSDPELGQEMITKFYKGTNSP